MHLGVLWVEAGECCKKASCRVTVSVGKGTDVTVFDRVPHILDDVR